VVWTSSNDVFYRYKSGSGWSSTTNVSATSTTSVSPGVSIISNSVHVVWQENLTGNREIYHRSRPVAGSWGVTQNLSANATPSVEPSVFGPVTGEPLVVWADSSGTNYDIKYKSPVSARNGAFTSTALQSHHPVFGTRSIMGGTRVVLLCTDGSTSLYQIGTDRKDFYPSLKISADIPDPSRVELTHGLALLQNSPNPFNPTTVLHFEIPHGGHVELKVFDLIGREVATLIDGDRPAGSHRVEFDGSNLPSGIYLYRLQHEAGTIVNRMVLVK